jgi:hypothetical protein
MGFCSRSQTAMINGINREPALTRKSKIKDMYFHILYSCKSHSARVELFAFTGEEYLEENGKVKKYVSLLTLLSVSAITECFERDIKIVTSKRRKRRGKE